MDEMIVRDSIDIAASPRAVWRTLTEPALTRQYMFGCDAVTDWKPGSAIEWVYTVDGKRVVAVKGVVLAVEPERLVSYTTFGVGMGIEDAPGNYLTLTCRLTPNGGGTRLAIEQGDYARVSDGKKRYHETVAGWSDVMRKLKAVAEAL